MFTPVKHKKLTKDKLIPCDGPHYVTVSATSFALPLGCSHLYVVSDIMAVG